MIKVFSGAAGLPTLCSSINDVTLQRPVKFSDSSFPINWKLQMVFNTTTALSAEDDSTYTNNCASSPSVFGLFAGWQLLDSWPDVQVSLTGLQTLRSVCCRARLFLQPTITKIALLSCLPPLLFPVRTLQTLSTLHAIQTWKASGLCVSSHRFWVPFDFLLLLSFWWRLRHWYLIFLSNKVVFHFRFRST